MSITSVHQVQLNNRIEPVLNRITKARQELGDIQALRTLIIRCSIMAYCEPSRTVAEEIKDIQEDLIKVYMTELPLKEIIDAISEANYLGINSEAYKNLNRTRMSDPDIFFRDNNPVVLIKVWLETLKMQNNKALQNDINDLKKDIALALLRKIEKHASNSVVKKLHTRFIAVCDCQLDNLKIRNELVRIGNELVEFHGKDMEAEKANHSVSLKRLTDALEVPDEDTVKGSFRKMESIVARNA